MEAWKVKMMLKYRNKSKDIRLCGDCKNTKKPPRKLSPYLLCTEFLVAVHKSQSVGYCEHYAIKDGNDDTKKEEKKTAQE